MPTRTTFEGHHRCPSRPRLVAVVTDTHARHVDLGLFDAVTRCLEDARPDLTVHLGDVADFAEISAHDKHPADFGSIRRDLESIRAEVWPRLKAVPGRKVVLEGNHDDRLVRHQCQHPGLYGLDELSFPSLSGMPASFAWGHGNALYQVGGDDWGVVFTHGDLRGRGRTSTAMNLLKKVRMSVICGHVHRFDSHYSSTFHGRQLEAHMVGWLADEKDAAGRYITRPEWARGFALVEFDHGKEFFNYVPIRASRDGSIRYGGTTYSPRARRRRSVA